MDVEIDICKKLARYLSSRDVHSLNKRQQELYTMLKSNGYIKEGKGKKSKK
jgi:hypothetical protein